MPRLAGDRGTGWLRPGITAGYGKAPVHPHFRVWGWLCVSGASLGLFVMRWGLRWVLGSYWVSPLACAGVASGVSCLLAIGTPSGASVFPRLGYNAWLLGFRSSDLLGAIDSWGLLGLSLAFTLIFQVFLSTFHDKQSCTLPSSLSLVLSHTHTMCFVFQVSFPIVCILCHSCSSWRPSMSVCFILKISPTPIFFSCFSLIFLLLFL